MNTLFGESDFYLNHFSTGKLLWHLFVGVMYCFGMQTHEINLLARCPSFFRLRYVMNSEENASTITPVDTEIVS